MSKQSALFIGYTDLESWLLALRFQDPNRPLAGRAVLSLGTVEPRHGSQGLDYRDYLHMVSFVDDDGRVHYCRIAWGTTMHIADQDFGHDNPTIRKRAVQGSDLVDRWLRAQGLVVLPATVAHARDLVLLDGWAAFLKWDKDAGAFAEPVDVCTQTPEAPNA